MRSAVTPNDSRASVTDDVIAPFDSFAMDPILYKHPNANGVSLPPKIIDALSVIEIAC